MYLDHFIKENLCCRYYVRYVDDFVILGNDKSRLHKIKSYVEEYLARIGLQVHSKKTQIFPVEQGTEFLGFKIFPTHRRVRKSNYYHFSRRLKRMQRVYHHNRNMNTFRDISQSVRSWIAHVSWGDTWELRKKLFSEVEF